MMFCCCQHLIVQYYFHLELCFYYLCFFFWKIVSSESLYLGWHWRNPICCLTTEWRRYHNAVSTSTKKCCKKYCKFTQRFQLRRGNSILPLSIRPLTTVCWARVQVLVPGLRLRAKRPFAPSTTTKGKDYWKRCEQQCHFATRFSMLMMLTAVSMFLLQRCSAIQ